MEVASTGSEAGCWRMGFRPFTSESYPEYDRPEAWRDVLNTVGLQPLTTPALYAGHATASHRSIKGVTLVKLTAGPQGLAPCCGRRDDTLPLILLPTEDGLVLRNKGHQIVPAGHLLALPSDGQWTLQFQRDLRAIGLHVTAGAFHGRKTGSVGLLEPRAIAPQGFAGLFARALTSAVQSLSELSDTEWETVAQGLADLLCTFTCQLVAPARDGGSSTRAAAVNRICQMIERELADPELTPARVAQNEGISERYLQKLFEGVGDNFSHYLRERRLQRAWTDLANPLEAHYTISEIAYRYGFGDSAHFSRTFRARFGLSPREFRHQNAERIAISATTAGHRGWPQDALAQLRQPGIITAPAKFAPLSAATGKHDVASEPSHHHLAIKADRVHWGFFSRSLRPQAEICSGDTITIETLTQHASDDAERMIAGDPAAEEIFRWTALGKTIDRRGAGPMDASVFGRGAGEGFGVHICTGPIAIRDAQPGDVLEVHILDIAPRRCRNPRYEGRVFGSGVSAWWGYHYDELLAEPKPREVITIYEIFDNDVDPHARGLYSYRWAPQTDPFGVIHRTYDYPGVPVSDVKRRHDVLEGIRIPLRLHFGVIALAPREADFVDSVPPSYFGGNLDNWRLGKGSTVYLPVSVPGALLSIGDPHATQGDGEISGTAIECSMTGTFRVILHKKAGLAGRPFADLTYPLIETATEWILTGFSHPNYLAEFGAQGQSEVYVKSSLDLAMKDAFRKMRRFLMNTKGLSEDEAIALMSVAVDFGVTQVVDGNWGVHAVLRKSLFSDTVPSS
jgi:acetamidase/formamidase/AraC-like DNA-binding protein